VQDFATRPQPTESQCTSYNESMLRLMCITAHPDDEAGSFGGSLRLYHDRGIETCVVCLTPGQAGTHRGGAASDQELATLRRKEFAAACEILKVSHGIVLDYPDGQLHRQDLYKVVCELTLHVRRLRPHVIITFGPDGSVTGHTDHSMTSVFATLAFHWAGRSNRYPEPDQRRNNSAPGSEALLQHHELHPARPPTGHAAASHRDHRNRRLSRDQDCRIQSSHQPGTPVVSLRIACSTTRTSGEVPSRRQSDSRLD
jgi:LmbE family N-acetylglucosaminyl deacetylase